MTKIDKPWGYEELIEHNDRYVMKKLMMKKGHRCSLQYHKYKKETIYVLEGELKISMGVASDKLHDEIFKPGDSFTLWPGMIHRAEGITDAVYLEASTPELDDVVRLKDDYDRV